MNIDSDEASKYVRKPTGFLDTEHPDRCSFDHSSLTKAFASHREQATAELIEALTEAARYIEGYRDMPVGIKERINSALTNATAQ